MPKKFEKAGYSAINRVFQRDAAISSDKPEERAPVEPESTPIVDKPAAVEPPPVKPEPVVELKPAARPSKPRAKAAPKPTATRRAKPAEKPEVGEEKPRRSTRAGGRLPAIRVECEPDEFADYQAMVFNLGRAAGHKLSHNILGRALVRIALELEDEIRKAAEKHPPRPRPANGDSEELALHEDEWEQAVREAMRTLPNKRSR